MRSLALSALVAALVLLPVSIGLGAADSARQRETVHHRLAQEAQDHAHALADLFERGRSLTLLTAREPAFRDFYADPGTRRSKVRRGTRSLHRALQTLLALRSLDRSDINELCFIDRSGSENARVVGDRAAPFSQLASNEEHNVFFGPTFATPSDEAYQSAPYVSPDTHRWVIGNSAKLPAEDGRSAAIVHFEVALDAFRAAADDAGTRIDVVDARTGAVVIGEHPSVAGGALPRAPAAMRALAARPQARGLGRLGSRLAAVHGVAVHSGNANRWVVVASEPAVASGLLHSLHGPTLVLLVLAAGLLTFGVVSLRASRRELEAVASTDPLTGLANRRRLMADLEHVAARAADSPATLMFFDLDGFKAYNDTFGHPAGDALLARLGRALDRAVQPAGRAYRLGGDEFCMIARGPEDLGLELRALDALSESGEGFAITASVGIVALPADATDPAQALRVADARMYEQKTGRRAGAGRQTADALLRALAERDPDLGEHTGGVTDLAMAVARRLGLDGDAVEHVRLAAELHDVGKLSVPDSILHKPGPLDDEEWAFMRRHTVIGERICAAAPGLSAVAPLVRSSHERWDGGGYPDGLAGEDIPLGARIVAVCDSYDAITSDRAYRAGRPPAVALEELERCAGAQFDPAVVEAFAALVGGAGPEHEPAPAGGALA